MVRLEIIWIQKHNTIDLYIYIPVWLDQKSILSCEYLNQSNIFTFQYGQIRNCYYVCRCASEIVIYIPVWLDQKFFIFKVVEVRGLDLHSSMVRLEMSGNNLSNFYIFAIYIPVWLDQKFFFLKICSFSQIYLHSSMVRLEITRWFTFLTVFM